MTDPRERRWAPCSCCCHTYMVRRDGRIRVHKRPVFTGGVFVSGPKCPGSGKEPWQPLPDPPETDDG